MAQEFKQGDKVRWNTPQGKTTGKVQKKITERMKIKDYQVDASEDEPQYLVKSDQSGEEAAHKPDALEKID